MANIRLKRISSDRKVKFIETPSGVFNLATGEEAKFDFVDPNNNNVIKPIYKTEDFVIENFTNTTITGDRVNNDIKVHGPLGRFNNIVQFDGYSLANKSETLSGISVYNYSTDEYEFDENDVAIYSPNENTMEYYESLVNVDHLLRHKDHGHMSEIPLNELNADYEVGVLYADSTVLKNEKNENYDVEGQVNFEDINLRNTRYYGRMGINNDNIWQSYKVGKNYTNNLILKENIDTIAQIPVDGDVYTSYLSGDKIYFGGNFTRVGGYLRNNFFAINSQNNIQDISFKENSYFLNLDNVFIWKFIETLNYFYILVRYYNSYDYTYHLIKMDKGGNILKKYINDNDINDFTIDKENNKMYVVGNFTQFEGYLRNYIICIDLNTDKVVVEFNPSFSKFNPGVYFELDSIFKINDEIFVSYNDTYYVIQSNNDVSTYIYKFDSKSNTTNVYISANNMFITNINQGLLKAYIYNTQPYTYMTKYSNNALNNNFTLSANGAINDAVINNSLIYFVGNFTTVNNTVRNYAACVDTNGVLQSWNPNLNAPANVIETSGNYLYIGGYFTTVSGLNRQRFCSITNDNFLTNFNPLSSSGNFSNVNAINFLNNYIYYSASLAQPPAASNMFVILKSTDLGNEYSIVENDLLTSDVSGNIFKLIFDTNDNIYFCSDYSQTGVNETSAKLLKYISDTVQDTDFIFDINARVNSIAIINDNIYVGGNFTSIRDIDNNNYNNQYLASINLTTKRLNNFSCNCNAEVKTLEAYGNDLYIGGDFTSVSGLNFRRFAILDTINNTLSNKNIKSYNTVTALLKNGNDIYISNLSSTILSAQLDTNIAKVSQNGSYFNEFDVTTGVLAINSIDFDTGNNVYLVGNFTSTNSNKTKSHFAKVNGSDGALQTLTLSANNNIYDIEVSGNNIYLYGIFTSISGNTTSATLVNYIANYNNSIIQDYNSLNLSYPNIIVNPYIKTKYLYTDIYSNNLYVINSKNIISGLTRNMLFETDLNGNISTFNPNIFKTLSETTSSKVNDIIGYKDSIYCATNCGLSGGLFKININGTIDAAFTEFMMGNNLGSGFTGWSTFNSINSLQLSGSILYFAGDLTYLDDNTKNLYVIDDLDNYTDPPR